MELVPQLPSLVELCMDAACQSKGSVQAWRRQIRTLERLPSHLADNLFHRLLHAGLLNPPLLELFQYSTEEIRVSGNGSINSEWTAYFKNFHCIRVFEAARCRALSNVAVSHLKGLYTLQELDLSCCPKVTDKGLAHLSSLKNLQKLGLSETKITAEGLRSLCVLKGLISLDLGGLPVTDAVLQAFTTLVNLQSLEVWGSKLSNHGVLYLKKFPSLRNINLAWTEVTRVPPLQSLEQLNMANCTIHSLFEAWNGVEGKLEVLNLSGTRMLCPLHFFGGIGANNLTELDFSSSSFQDIELLNGLKTIKKLDLSGTMVQDTAMTTIANLGENLQHLDLSGCSVTSAGIGNIAGHVPRLQHLVLSGTLVDNLVFASLQSMPSLLHIDLSYTNIKGSTVDEEGRASNMFSLDATNELPMLKMLNLQNTLISDHSCLELSCFSELTNLDLRSELLSDSCLEFLSCLKKLVALSIEGAMLTDSGLLSFKTPPLLKFFSLLDCWLLTEKAMAHFCTAHKDLFVKHALVPVVSGAGRSIFLKERRIKGSLTSNSNYGKMRSHENKKANLTVFGDQRVKYSRSDLLELRMDSPSNEQLDFVGFDLRLLLSNPSDITGLLKI